MSSVTITTYYCDRCGEEIKFEHIKPTICYNVEYSSSKLHYGNSRKHYKELCNECGKELERFLDGVKLAY